MKVTGELIDGLVKEVTRIKQEGIDQERARWVAAVGEMKANIDFDAIGQTAYQVGERNGANAVLEKLLTRMEAK